MVRFINELPNSISCKLTINHEGCWIHSCKPDTNGYVRITYLGKRHLIHRLVYTLLVGRIDESLVLDHICHDANKCALGSNCPHRKCCNPEHLKQETAINNSRRRSKLPQKSHCGKGHRFTEKNTMYKSNGYRYCKTCSNDSSLKRSTASKAARLRSLINRWSELS